MQKLRAIPIIIALLLMVMNTACAKQAVAGPKPTPVPTVAMKDFEDFNRANFTHPTVIDNKWHPFLPGTQFIYAGTTREDGEDIPHRVVTTVTGLTKVIDGVPSLVEYVIDYSNDQPVEVELAFFAQDNQGNVWRMGEHPEAYDNGVFVEAPTWISGVQDAHAGISFPGDPKLGASSFSQGWAPAVTFTDRGQVAETGMQVCIPLGCFEDVVMIRESSKEEVNAYQIKYFAPGKYNVRVDWVGADQKQEILELVEIKTLSPEELAKLHEEALQVEKHAYEISKEVYGRTPPMALATKE